MVPPKRAPGPAIPEKKSASKSGTGSNGRVIKGAGKGKIVVTRNPGDAAQSGDAFMVAGGATDTANDRTTDGAAQTEALLAHTGVRLPLSIGAILSTRRRNGELHLAVVIERRRLADDSEEYDYYMHYEGFNRRMDEWVSVDQLDLEDYEKMLRSGKVHKFVKHEDEEDHKVFDAQTMKEHDEFTKVKNIERIELGRYVMETWYFSPLPERFRDCKILYFSEFDLEFFSDRSQMLRHVKKLKRQHPPGVEIYRKAKVSMYEIDGRTDRTYCQNLSYLAKLFLDHKTLWWDVDLFLFYVLCESDERGSHIVGYFSKEKVSDECNNLACILMLPSYQRKGYGKFLISFSYELSKVEGKVGSPERPLSDLGQVSYRGYWTRCLLGVLLNHSGTISIQDLSNKTSIKTEDIVATLQHLDLIRYHKGQHVFVAVPEILEQHMKAAGGPGLIVDPSKIVWTAYSPERDLANFKG